MMIDSLGDTAVCLINLATQMGLDFNECLEHAYNEIKDRKGKNSERRICQRRRFKERKG